MQKLSLSPAGPTTGVMHRFLLFPGRLHVEMCVDRAVVFYGEKFDLHVAITNFSNKTIRKIKCELIQVSLLPLVGERRASFFCLETTEDCPILPGGSLHKVYNFSIAST